MKEGSYQEAGWGRGWCSALLFCPCSAVCPWSLPLTKINLEWESWEPTGDRPQKAAFPGKEQEGAGSRRVVMRPTEYPAPESTSCERFLGRACPSFLLGPLDLIWVFTFSSLNVYGQILSLGWDQLPWKCIDCTCGQVPAWIINQGTFRKRSWMDVGPSGAPGVPMEPNAWK